MLLTIHFQCSAMWLEPAFGANGLYYRVVPAPSQLAEELLGQHARGVDEMG